MSPAIIGFLRGIGYSATGGAIAGVIYFLSTQPLWAIVGGIGITGIVAAWEHKHNIPTFAATPQ